MGQQFATGDAAGDTGGPRCAAQVDLDGDIGGRRSLAGEDEVLLHLCIGEEVGGLGRLVDGALDESALTGGAAAHAAAVGEGNALAEGRREQRLARRHREALSVHRGGVRGRAGSGRHESLGALNGLNCAPTKRGMRGHLLTIGGHFLTIR